MGVLSACMAMYYVCALYPWKPEDGIESLALALQIVVSHCVYAGNWIQFSGKAISTFSLLIHFYNPL